MNRHLGKVALVGSFVFLVVGCAGQSDELADESSQESSMEEHDGHDGPDVLEEDDAAATEEDANETSLTPGVTAYRGRCPAAGRISQGWHQRHDGVDIANARGTPIFSTGPGVVTFSGPAQGYGQMIRVRHDDGSMTEYGHMFRRDVRVNQRVAAGQRIALMGSEGQSSGPHLHLRTYRNANVIGAGRGMNPVVYLRERGVALPCRP